MRLSSVLLLLACGPGKRSNPASPGRVACALGEPRDVADLGAPASVERGSGAISAAFGPSDGFVVVTSPNGTDPPVGTWALTLDPTTGEAGPLQPLSEHRVSHVFVRPVSGGAFVVGWSVPDGQEVVQGWWLDADGRASEPVHLGDDWLVAVSAPDRDRVAVVVSNGSPWDLSVHQLSHAEGRVQVVELAPVFRAKSRSDRPNRVALHDGAWALIDGDQLWVDGEARPLPEGGPVRNVVWTDDGLAVWDERSEEGDLYVRRHHWPIEGGPPESSGEQRAADVELPFDPGVSAIVGPHPDGGTSIEWGPSTWHLPDDDSLAETWIGETGQGHALLYASADRLVYRRIACR